MSEQENPRIATANFDYYNAHDLDSADQFLADDYKSGASGGAELMDKKHNRIFMQNFRTAFPDLHFEVTQTEAQGDQVVIDWVARGTHNGPLGTPSGGTIEATGKKATVPGCSTYYIKDGKITLSTAYYDMVGLLGQLGLLTPM